jgi:hypothetical protein
VKTRLGVEDYEALGLRVVVLDFKPLRIRIEGAISVEVDHSRSVSASTSLLSARRSS